MAGVDANVGGALMATYTDAQIDAALHVIATSEERNVKKLLRSPLPTYHTLLYRSKNDPDFKERFNAALRNREGRAFANACDLDKAMAFIRADCSQSLRSYSLKSGSPLEGLYRLSRRSAEYARLMVACQERRQSRQIDVARKRASGWRASHVRPPLAGNQLMNSLAENDLYSRIDKALPRSLMPHHREDLRSELMLAVVCGDITLDDAVANIDEHRRSFNRDNQLFFMDSLDAPKFDGESGSVGDFMSANEWSYEAAA